MCAEIKFYCSGHHQSLYGAKQQHKEICSSVLSVGQKALDTTDDLETQESPIRMGPCSPNCHPTSLWGRAGWRGWQIFLSPLHGHLPVRPWEWTNCQLHTWSAGSAHDSVLWYYCRDTTYTVCLSRWTWGVALQSPPQWRDDSSCTWNADERKEQKAHPGLSIDHKPIGCPIPCELSITLARLGGKQAIPLLSN